MNLEFYSAHMRTLGKLMKMADERGCHLGMGHRTENSPDADFDMVAEIDGQEFADFASDCFPSRQSTDSDTIYFELIDKDGHCSVNLTYVQKNTFFELDELDLSRYEREGKGPKMEDLAGRSEYSEKVFSYTECPTYVYKEETKKRTKDNRVYRPGMALKYFSDLVCEYFHEPEIEENY